MTLILSDMMVIKQVEAKKPRDVICSGWNMLSICSLNQEIVWVQI